MKQANLFITTPKRLLLLASGLTVACLLIWTAINQPHNVTVESCYIRLRPDGYQGEAGATVFSTFDLNKVQKEFKSFGPNANSLLLERIKSYFSTGRLLMLWAKQSYASKESIQQGAWREGERLMFGIEALGSDATPVLPELRRELLNRRGGIGRKQFAARLISRVGKTGTSLLCDELANPSVEVRQASLSALKELVSRLSERPGGIDASDMDARTVVALMDDEDYEWKQRSYQIAWVFGTNSTPITQKVVSDMKGGDLTKRTQASEALVAALATQASEHPAFRSLFTDAFIILLMDPEPTLRRSAITALVKAAYRDPTVIAGLQRALLDSDEIVREIATNALRQLSKPTPP